MKGILPVFALSTVFALSSAQCLGLKTINDIISHEYGEITRSAASICIIREGKTQLLEKFERFKSMRNYIK